MPLPWEEELLRRVQRFEGFSPRPYGDYKQTSVGFGTRYRPGQDTSRESLEGDLRRELQQATSQVRGRFPNVPEDRVGPLSSFTYNVGPGWMDKSPRLRGAVEAGDWDAAGRVMQEYNRAGGQVLPGLQRRRAAEAEGLRQGWGEAQAQELPQAPLGAPAIAGNTFGTPAGWEGQRMSLGAGAQPPGGLMSIIQGILGGGPAAAQAPAAAPEQFGPPASMMAPPMEAPQTPPPEPQMPAPPPDMPAFPPLHDPSAFPQQPEPPPGIAMTPQTPRLPGVQVPPVPPATDTAAAPTVQPAPPGWGPQGAPPGVERRGPPGGMAPQQGGGGLYDYFAGGAQGGFGGLLQSLNAGLGSRGVSMALPLAFGQAGAQSAAAGQGAHELAIREAMAGREQTKFGQEQEAYQARRRAWEGAFPGGQPNMEHPLLKGMNPELAATVQAMGPDAGIEILGKLQMKGAEQAMVAQQREQLARSMGLGGGQPQEATAAAPPPAQPVGSFGGAGIGGAMPGVEYTPPPALAPQITSPGAPAAPRGGAAAPGVGGFNVMADPTVQQAMRASILSGDMSGVATAIEQAGRQYRDLAMAGPKREAETLAGKRAEQQVSDEKRTQSAKDMWSFTEQLEQAGNALGKSRLNAAMSPSFDDPWLGNKQRWTQPQAYNDRRVLQGYIDNIIIQARETQRGLGPLTEGEQATLERAYAGMKEATTADDFYRHIDTVRHALSGKIPGKEGFKPRWLKEAETGAKQEEERERKALQPPKPDEGATAVKKLSSDQEGQRVYKKSTGQWGTVVNGDFVADKKPGPAPYRYMGGPGL